MDFRCQPSECRAIMRLSAFYSDRVSLTRFAHNPAPYLLGHRSWPSQHGSRHSQNLLTEAKSWIYIVILYLIYTTINWPSVGTRLWQKPCVQSKHWCQTWPDGCQVRHSIHTYRLGWPLSTSHPHPHPPPLSHCPHPQLDEWRWWHNSISRSEIC